MSREQDLPRDDAGRPPGTAAEELQPLTPLVYADLRRIAATYMERERPGHTLTPTALVHEAVERLLRDEPPEARSRSHLIALAARVMRRVLIEHARAHAAWKRGAGWERVTLRDGAQVTRRGQVDLLDLEDALARLEALDERQGRVVEMRFFGGLTMEEIARVLNVSKRSVENDWALARAWLRRELTLS